MLTQEQLSSLTKNIRETLSSENRLDDLAVKAVIENSVLESSYTVHFSPVERQTTMDQIFNRLRRYDVLQPLLDDDRVTEIMINGPEQVFIEMEGRIQPSNVRFESAERLEAIVQQIVSEVDRKVNRSEPIADARLKDGSRVNVVLPPIALDGAAVTIRKFSKDKLTMSRLIELGALNSEIADFLKALVKNRFNILICGGTGSGKTTFLNALSDYIPSDERIVTIEDSAELKITDVPNIIRLEARERGTEESLNVTMRDLIKSSLRMRPDRIIVGEVRGAEAIDMLQAMNTGHDGSITTGHSNSGKDMLNRLETMILSSGGDVPLHSIRSQIASGLDIVVYLRRFKDGSRRVVSIDELKSYSDNQIEMERIYSFDRQNGFVKQGELMHTWKFETYE